MIHRRPQVIALTVLIAIAAGLLFAPAVSAQESGNPDVENGVIQNCTTIDESGTYTLDSNIEASPDEACLTIESGDVTIDGNGNELTGNEDSAIGVVVDAPAEDGPVVIDNIRILYWGDWGLDHRNGDLVVRDSDLMWNGAGYNGDQFSSLEMENLNIKMNKGAGMHTMMAGLVDLTRVEIVGNEGTGFGMLDGGRVTIDDSIFNSNDGYGLSVGHAMRVEATDINVAVNGEGGVLLADSAMQSEMSIADSRIVGNQGHGVHGATSSSSDEYTSMLKNVELQNNDGKDLDFYDEDDGFERSEIVGENVDLGGIVVSFGEQSLDIDTQPSDEMESDVLVLEGPSSLEVQTTFSVERQQGRLWYDAPDGWERRGEYDTGDSGTFSERLSTGRWGATSADQQTSTPTATAEPTPTPTEEPTPTNEPTDEPSTQEPSTATDTPTETASGGEPIVAPRRITTDTPTEAATDAPAGETTETAASTDIPAETDTPAETGTPLKTATENGTSAPATETATTGGDDGEPSDDSGSSWQFYGISVAIILLLATLTASLVSWE